jgi:transcriptional regulator with XRE-family HTH domain
MPVKITHRKFIWITPSGAKIRRLGNYVLNMVNPQQIDVVRRIEAIYAVNHVHAWHSPNDGKSITILSMLSGMHLRGTDMLDPLDTGDLDKDVARRLILSRLAMNMQPGEFADRAGLTQSNYSQYENLWRSLSIRAAMKLCTVYGLTLDWLYRGDPSGLSIRLNSAINDATDKHAQRVMRELDAAPTSETKGRRRSRVS